MASHWSGTCRDRVHAAAISSLPKAGSMSADEIFAVMAGLDEPAADLSALVELEAISRAASISVHTALAEREIREERIAVIADRAVRWTHARVRADCFGYERFVPDEEDLISARQSSRSSTFSRRRQWSPLTLVAVTMLSSSMVRSGSILRPSWRTESRVA